MKQAEQARDQHCGEESQPWIARIHGHAEGGHGPHQHHALNAQVQNAGSLGENLADGGKEQYRPAGYACL